MSNDKCHKCGIELTKHSKQLFGNLCVVCGLRAAMKKTKSKE